MRKVCAVVGLVLLLLAVLSALCIKPHSEANKTLGVSNQKDPIALPKESSQEGRLVLVEQYNEVNAWSDSYNSQNQIIGVQKQSDEPVDVKRAEDKDAGPVPVQKNTEKQSAKMTISNAATMGPAAVSESSKESEPTVIHHEAEYRIIYHDAKTVRHEAVIVHHDAEYQTVHHDAVTEDREVIDSESYCSFRYIVLCCTSPKCCNDGETDWQKYYRSVFSAKDYDYNMQKLYKAYSDHEYKHLTNGEQGSFTDVMQEGRASASKYEYLLAEQNSTPRAVTALKLVPQQSHTEKVVIKEAYEEQVLIREAWDEIISEAYDEVIPAWEEKVLVKEAWDELIP